MAGAVFFGEFVATVATWFAVKARRRLPKLPPAVPVLAGVALLAVAIGGFSRGGYIGLNSVHVKIAYRGFPAVSADEEVAFAWLAQHTVPGERVLNDRIDGSVWMYALQGVHPLQWNYYGAEPDTDVGYVSRFANVVRTDSRVREILTDLTVRYVFVGKGNAMSNRPNDPGLMGLDTTPGFKPVYRNEGASIYEIEGQQGVIERAAARSRPVRR